MLRQEHHPGGTVAATGLNLRKKSVSKYPYSCLQRTRSRDWLSKWVSRHTAFHGVNAPSTDLPEAWSVVMGGCGIKGGHVVGQTNSLGTFVESEEYDIGHLFHTWFRALGVPDESMEYINNGQPLPVANEECFAIEDLLT